MKTKIGHIVNIYGIDFIYINHKGEDRYVNLKEYKKGNITCTDGGIYR